tara:strand:+ start:1793 stop:2164 length:372 start_codon:yes stop_codon:yes gene_type:complete
MILTKNNMGVGIDIVLVSRVEKILKSKNKDRFLNKIFSDKEISNSEYKYNQSQYFSGRFAAKEAIKKALSSYNKNSMPTFKSLEILNADNGKPYVSIKSKQQSDIDISIAHDGNYAIAFCVVK